MPVGFPIINTADTPRTWWGVENGENHNGYNILMQNGYYRFGCRGDSRHKGLDIRPKRSGNFQAGFWDTNSRNRLFAWGYCICRYNGYDDEGYHRYMQVYFPTVNASLTLGHLLNGTAAAVGETFQRGDVLSEIGTKADGLGARHVHYRAAWGDHRYPIGPCEDIDPAKVWRALRNYQEKN